MFVAGGDELEEQVRGVLLERYVADFVDDDQPVAAQLGPVLRRAGRVGVRLCSRATQSMAVANRTRWPELGGARGPEPVARCVLPVPGGPSRTTLLCFGRGTHRWPGARWCRGRRPGWWSKLKSSSDFRPGNPAARMRGFGAGGFPGGDFPGQDRGEVFLVGPAGLAGLVGEPGCCFPDPGRFHRPGVVLDLAGGFPGPRPSRDLPVHRRRHRRPGRSRPGPRPVCVHGRGAGCFGTLSAAPGRVRHGPDR